MESKPEGLAPVVEQVVQLLVSLGWNGFRPLFQHQKHLLTPGFSFVRFAPPELRAFGVDANELGAVLSKFEEPLLPSALALELGESRRRGFPKHRAELPNEFLHARRLL